MSLREEVVEAPAAPRTLINLESQLTRLLYLDAEKIAYGLIFILAIISRFWDLGARVMSHDESHTSAIPGTSTRARISAHPVDAWSVAVPRPP
jgi:hypothetical protein